MPLLEPRWQPLLDHGVQPGLLGAVPDQGSGLGPWVARSSNATGRRAGCRRWPCLRSLIVEAWVVVGDSAQHPLHKPRPGTTVEDPDCGEVLVGMAAAAAYLGVKVRHLRYQIEQGRLYPSRDGRRLVFATRDLDAWSNACSPVPAARGTLRGACENPDRPRGVDQLDLLADTGLDLNAVAVAIGARADRAQRWPVHGVPNRWIGAVRGLVASLPAGTTPHA